MSFLPGSPKKHPLQDQLERFSRIYDAFFESLARGAGPRDTHVTVLARSSASPMCRVIADRAADFQKRGVTVQTIFAKLGPAEPMVGYMTALQRTNRAGNVAMSMRWAKNPCLLDAHEQLTLGLRMCWTGDCMRRSPDSRNGLDLFEDNSLSAVRLGELAFSAMWSASKPLPKELFDEDDHVREPEDADAATVADRLTGAANRSGTVIKLRAQG